MRARVSSLAAAEAVIDLGVSQAVASGPRARLPGRGPGNTIVVSHGAIGRVLRGLYGHLPQDEILALDEPQDAIFRLTQGTVARIDHEAA